MKSLFSVDDPSLVETLLAQNMELNVKIEQLSIENATLKSQLPKNFVPNTSQGHFTIGIQYNNIPKRLENDYPVSYVAIDFDRRHSCPFWANKS